jgi:hypothetical protein
LRWGARIYLNSRGLLGMGRPWESIPSKNKKKKVHFGELLRKFGCHQILDIIKSLLILLNDIVVTYANALFLRFFVRIKC